MLFVSHVLGVLHLMPVTKLSVHLRSFAWAYASKDNMYQNHQLMVKAYLVVFSIPNFKQHIGNTISRPGILIWKTQQNRLLYWLKSRLADCNRQWNSTFKYPRTFQDLLAKNCMECYSHSSFDLRGVAELVEHFCFFDGKL